MKKFKLLTLLAVVMATTLSVSKVNAMDVKPPEDFPTGPDGDLCDYHVNSYFTDVTICKDSTAHVVETYCVMLRKEMESVRLKHIHNIRRDDDLDITIDSEPVGVYPSMLLDYTAIDFKKIDETLSAGPHVFQISYNADIHPVRDEAGDILDYTILCKGFYYPVDKATYKIHVENSEIAEGLKAGNLSDGTTIEGSYDSLRGVEPVTVKLYFPSDYFEKVYTIEEVEELEEVNVTLICGTAVRDEELRKIRLSNISACVACICMVLFIAGAVIYSYCQKKIAVNKKED